MSEKYKVLWIEDAATYHLQALAAPVYYDGRYDLDIVEDASAALRRLLGSEYQVVIVDIRLPPGDDPRWIEVYKQAGYDKVGSRLGLEIIKSVLGKEDAKVPLGTSPSWKITPEKIGVLTVEGWSDMQRPLQSLEIRVFQTKGPAVKETVLLDLIEQVLQQQA